MSRRVHTSVWLSDLPSPTRSAHTDTNSAGPGCQRMRGERVGGRNSARERKYPRTQAHPGLSLSNNNNNQHPEGAVNPMDYFVHLLESDAVFLAVILPVCTLKNTINVKESPI